MNDTEQKCGGGYANCDGNHQEHPCAGNFSESRQQPLQVQACGDCGQVGDPMRFHTKLDCIAYKYIRRRLPAEDIATLFRYAEVGEAAYRAPDIDEDAALKLLRKDRKGAINVH